MGVAKRVRPLLAGGRRGWRAPVRELVGALLHGDPSAVFALCEGFAGGASRVAVFADLLQVALQEIAERWYRGSVPAEREAGAAALVAAAVERLAPTPSPTPVAAGSRCALVLPPGEEHTLGLRMLSLALEDDGWTVPAVTAPDWPACLEALASGPRPRFVGVSAGCVRSRSALAGAIRAIRARGIPVLVGGAAFARAPALWEQLGASGCGADARVAVVLARRYAATASR